MREMSSWPAGQLGLLPHNSSALVRGRAGAQLMHTLLLVCAVAPRGVPSPMERKHGSVDRSVAGARYGDAAPLPKPAAAASHCVSTATTVPNKAPVLQSECATCCHSYAGEPGLVLGRDREIAGRRVARMSPLIGSRLHWLPATGSTASSHSRWVVGTHRTHTHKLVP